MDEPKLTAVSKRDLYFIFGALMLGMLLAALDGTIKSEGSVGPSGFSRASGRSRHS